MFGSVTSLTKLSNADLVATGSFGFVGGSVVSAYVARLTTTCPASVTPYGTGCPSSGGNNTLTAENLPWVWTTFTAQGNGLPVNSPILLFTGFDVPLNPTVPLSVLFGAAAAVGCDAIAFPEIADLTLSTAAGTATSALFLPNTPPLVGRILYHQMVPIDAGPGNSVTATNALQIVCGHF